MYVRATFYPGGVFHVYNRGIAKSELYHDPKDYQHFLDTLSFYLDQSPALRFSKATVDERRKVFSRPAQDPLVQVLAYCLMPNHFHLMLREVAEHGVSTFMRRAMNSYTRAYNTRYKRVGTVFQGTFSAVTVESPEQYLHLSRYIHLNPYVARLVDDPATYAWSSYPLYLKDSSSRLVQPDDVLAAAGGPETYQAFMEDYASYARDVSIIRKLVLEDE